MASLYREKEAYFNFNNNNQIKDPNIPWQNLKATLLLDKRAKNLSSHFPHPNLINRHFLTITGNQSLNFLTMSFFNLIGLEKHRQRYYNCKPGSHV